MKTEKTLHLQEIINLEYFLKKDEKTAPALLHKRDREFATSFLKKESNPSAAIISWLSFRLKEEFGSAEQRSPGELFADFFQLVRIVVTFVAIAAGSLAGLGFFSYSGTTPVNVFQFLLLFIAPQLFLLALLLFSLTAARLLPSISIPSFYALLAKRLYAIITTRLQRSQHISVAQRNAYAHALAIIKLHGSRYGSLFYWPFFSLFQGTGLAFNLALLAVSLIKIATCDLAFGWQSTIQFSDAAIHQLTTTLALPWLWIDSGAQLLPTMAEIAGSRIVLKDGIYHLATTNLTSWWPFLLMCLLVYGVFTRMLFLALGCFMGGRGEAALYGNLPDMPQCKALLQRMATPLVTTQANDKAKLAESPSAVNSRDFSPVQPLSSLPQTVFAAIDIYEQLANPQQELAAALTSHGITPQKIIPFLTNYQEDQKLLSQLNNETKEIILLLEGWMVPLVSLLGYIKEIRQRIGQSSHITIALVGRPDDTIFTAVTGKDFAIWQQKITALADPYIQIIALAGVEEERR